MTTFGYIFSRPAKLIVSHALPLTIYLTNAIVSQLQRMCRKRFTPKEQAARDVALETERKGPAIPLCRACELTAPTQRVFQTVGASRRHPEAMGFSGTITVPP